MPAWQKPDPAAEIGKLKRDVEELSRIVRRGKPAPNMRDLADATLAKANDGQVPVYDSTSGTWIPGSAGGGGEVLEIITDTGATSGGNFIFTHSFDNGAVSVDWDEATDATYIQFLADGMFLAVARVRYSASGTEKTVSIKLDGSEMGGGYAGASTDFVNGVGLHVAEPVGDPGSNYRLTLSSATTGAVTPSYARLAVVFFPGGFTFRAS